MLGTCFFHFHVLICVDSFIPLRFGGFLPLRVVGFMPLRSDNFIPLRFDGFMPLRFDSFTASWTFSYRFRRFYSSYRVDCVKKCLDDSKRLRRLHVCSAVSCLFDASTTRRFDSFVPFRRIFFSLAFFPPLYSMSAVDRSVSVHKMIGWPPFDVPACICTSQFIARTQKPSQF